MQRYFAIKCGAFTGVALLLSACPAPIPTCEDTRTYVPQVAIWQMNDASLSAPDSAVVVGRIAFNRPDPLTRLSVVLLRLVDDEAVAIQTVWLEADGRFHWILMPGTYAIPLARLHSDYRDWSYQREQGFAVNMRFEAVANEAHYLGTLTVDTSAAPSQVGDVRPGEVSVRRLAVRNDWGAERATDPTLQRQGGRVQVTLMEPDQALPSYSVRPRTGCAKWSNVCWLLLAPYGGCLNSFQFKR